MEATRFPAAPLLLMLVVVIPAFAYATPATPKLDPTVIQTLECLAAGRSSAEIRDRGYPLSADGALDVFILGTATRDELESRGALVRTSVGGIATAYVPPDAIPRFVALGSVERIVGSRQGELALDLAVPATGAHLLRGPGPEFAGLNGSGIVIGAVDSGVDLAHGDMRFESDHTRLLAVWDQTGTGPPPEPFDYGTEWTSTEIDQGLATEVDTDGHGTAVLSAAAGDGSATGAGIPAYTYTGMAPAADLVMVKARPTYETTDVVDGVFYIFDVAAGHGKPAVANLSLQYRWGPHDGTSVFETALDALTGGGRILCVAAGNWRGLDVHAEVLAGDADNVVQWDVNGTQAGASIWVDGYYDNDNVLAVEVTTPLGETIGPVELGETMSLGNIFVFHGMGYSVLHPEIWVSAWAEIPGEHEGTWALRFLPRTLGESEGEVDLWTGSSKSAAIFLTHCQPYEEQVSEPGTARSVITAGAWSTKERYIACNGDTIGSVPGITAPAGELAPFSGPGPTRDSRLKPDVAAPGVWICSALSADTDPQCPEPGIPTGILPDLEHRASAGTSFSAPITSGAIALLLQSRGYLSPEEVRAIVCAWAVKDEHTGDASNNDWGCGKLSVEALVAGLNAEVASREGLSVVPNPSSGPFLILWDAEVRSDIEILDASGRRLARLATTDAGMALWPAPGEGSSSGTYFARARNLQGQTITRKLSLIQRRD